MTLLIVGLVLFLGVHSVSIIARGWRDGMVERLGEGPWKGLYSLVSLVGFGLVIYGWTQARLSPVLIWMPPAGLRHAVMLLMLPVFILLLAVYLPGRISRMAGGHPMLLATKIWASSHLLANGYLHEMLLFGGFLVWGVADRISMKRRGPGPAAGAAEGGRNDVLAVIGGLALYAVTVLWGHQWFAGVGVISLGG